MELTISCTTRPYGKYLDFAEACAKIAAAGYTDVAVFRCGEGMPVSSESTPEEAKAAAQTAADAGVAPSMLIGRTQLNLGLDAAIDDYKTLIDRAADLGATWLLDCGIGNEDMFEDYFELMRRAAPHAQDAGVNITLKPHGGITLTVDQMLAANDKVNHPAFGLCFDPGNIIYYTKGDLRPETDVDKIAPKVTTGIIKDCTVDKEADKADVMVTPGEGLVDFPAVLGGLVNNGFAGPLYVECVGGEELDEIDANVRKTLPFVKGILAGL